MQGLGFRVRVRDNTRFRNQVVFWGVAGCFGVSTAFRVFGGFIGPHAGFGLERLGMTSWFSSGLGFRV